MAVASGGALRHIPPVCTEKTCRGGRGAGGHEDQRNTQILRQGDLSHTVPLSTSTSSTAAISVALEERNTRPASMASRDTVAVFTAEKTICIYTAPPAMV